jgi:hypothetical protein
VKNHQMVTLIQILDVKTSKEILSVVLRGVLTGQISENEHLLYFIFRNATLQF